MRELKLVLPIRIQPSKRGKKYALNLNIYRNLHFNTLNNIKVLFKEKVIWMLNGQSLQGYFKKPYVRYTFYADNNRHTDMMNWVSVVDKFVMDALVELKVLRDDSTEYIKEVQVTYGGVDKGNGRVEMEITE